MAVDSQIESYESGKVVVVSPTDKSAIVPLFCNCCAFTMKTIEDSISYRKHGVCAGCDGRWTNDKRVDWKAGILPDKSGEDWQEYIVIRSISAKQAIIFR